MMALTAIFRATAVLLCAALWLPTRAIGQVAPVAGSPRIEDGDCPFTATPDVLEQIRCGTLIVPQDRAVPDGRQLRLAFAVLKSRGTTPRPDPVVYLSGGPGHPALPEAPYNVRSPFWDGLRAERDVVFFDQRGTGYSEPRFCSELSDVFFETTFAPANERLARRSDALARCRTAMEADGIDLSQYNSVASALDLRDLRVALGYEEWNLLGNSYGTRLALVALREAPEGIRSAVLDGPAPPNATHHIDVAPNLADVVSRLAALCAAEAACQAAYPRLEERIWRLVGEARDRPLLVTGGGRFGLPPRVSVDGELLARLLYEAFYERDLLPLVPLFVQQAERRNTRMLAVLLAERFGRHRGFGVGLMLAVECHESLPFNQPEALERARGRYPAVLEDVGLTVPYYLVHCDAWHPHRAAARQAEPVRSDVPVLILAGEFDPVTHRSYGPLAAASLSRARVVELPAASHGTAMISHCTRTLVAGFLNDPASPLDVACVDAMEPLRFVTGVRLLPGVNRVASPVAPERSGANLIVPFVMAGSALLLLSTVGWPAAAVVRRLRGRPRRVTNVLERGARWGAGLLAAAYIGFVIKLQTAIDATFARNPFILIFGLVDWPEPLLVLPWLLLLGACCLAGAAVIAWRRKAWTRNARIHFTLVAVASVVFGVFLTSLGIG